MENTINTYAMNNPLADLISDDIFQLLDSRGLINEKSVRDYKIRQKFYKLRKKKLSAGKAILIIREDYPYLQPDTIRKIVYNSK